MAYLYSHEVTVIYTGIVFSHKSNKFYYHNMGSGLSCIASMNTAVLLLRKFVYKHVEKHINKNTIRRQ
jgi:hypothetical protein